MVATCLEAVRREMLSLAAISLSARPSASRRSTSCSRGGQAGHAVSGHAGGRPSRVLRQRRGHVDRLVEREGIAGRPRRGEALRPERGAGRGDRLLVKIAVEQVCGNSRADRDALRLRRGEEPYRRLRLTERDRGGRGLSRQ